MCTDFDMNLLDLDLLGNLNCTDLDMGNSSDFCFENTPPTYFLEGIINAFENPHPKPMDQWETKEVLDFIYNEISTKNKEVSHYHLERFQCISGYIFRNLTEDNCKILSNSNYIGELIFNAKEKYIRCHPAESFENNNYLENSLASENFDEESIDDSGKKIPTKYSKKPGRPKCKTIPDKLGKRSEKLWEFLLHLLRDTKTCPQLIKWENFQEGTFKFVQSDKVARLWGNRKKNDNMTYEKFSRAMRYYYKSEVLLPVPGKRLVYKFGPQATGWNNMTPIS